MNLFIITSLLIILLTFCGIYKKYINEKNVIFLLFIFIGFVYFMLQYNYTRNPVFSEKTAYNRLVKSVRNGNLHIDTVSNPLLKLENVYKIYPYLIIKDKSLEKYFDLSYYNNRIYIYWGITPIILCYLPFNLITGLYLSDNTVVFIVCLLIFLVSVKIIRQLLNINCSMIYIYIIIAGLCNYSLFLLIRPAINEVCVSFAALFLLLSICCFVKFININKNILIFFIALFLSLAVGCRPHYVLFIPLFFMFILFESLSKAEENYKLLFKQILIFLIPCIVLGTIIAVYNYVRFDSVFEFGWKYQLNKLNQYDYTATIKDFLLGFKYHLLQFPTINNSDNYTVFSLVKAIGQRNGNDLIAGLIYVYPFCVLVIAVPFLLFSKINKNLKIVIYLLSLIFLVNFCIACLFGTITRYSFEYIYIAVILSIIIYETVINYINNKNLKIATNIFFIVITVFTIYMQVSLLLCAENASYFLSKENLNFYNGIIHYIFNTDLIISV